MKKWVNRAKHVGWLIVFLVGFYFIVYGYQVMNTYESIETKHVWTYVQYFNGINAGNLIIELTSVGTISALESVNASIDLHWFYPSSPNPVFSIYFWGAYPKPTFPFNETIPPPTPKIYLLHRWEMPENHFMANATLVWMTSGIFGVTIEEVNPGIPITTYNITRLIEVEPAYAPSRFREAHVLEGQQWIGIGLAVVFSSISAYQITERWKKRQHQNSK